ncbi:hypothetical protein PV05_00225 [Exophiala xenobiotica]|uniref:Luciferase-like domain-containing protein n=1 Tax=Exophiala xenobiotica TaxID=348802 RepID=A0A0D2EW32_9EURO|nr:uncharacterized protein PV05_00225 [Exophiala xenobiotica]KIW59968.1 hypothetical protein PV05_00225 [Exophiala xenobiotica]
MGKRQIQLAFFETACTGNFVCAGQWRSPGEISSTKDRIDYYMKLAQLAERGKILCVFFADSYGGKEVYGGSQAPLLKAGTQVAQLDPVTLISALGMVTNSVCFGITGSTSYLKPYMLARTWSSLDHLTNGRVGWNVVTSYSKEVAFALGLTDVVARRQALRDG